MLARFLACSLALAGVIVALVHAATGDVDPSFGNAGPTSFYNAGMVITGPSASELHALALQPDGRILVGGYSPAPFTTLVRLDPDGAPDPTFGRNGEAQIYGYGYGEWSGRINAILLPGDGTIVIAGGIGPAVLVHLRADGTLDPTFADGGVVVADSATGIGYASTAALQPDGKIVTGGYPFTLARYTADGRLDPTFGAGGVVRGTVGTTNVDVGAISIQPDGRIVAAGTAWTAAGTLFVLRRYEPDGTLDPDFGTAGDTTALQTWQPGLAIEPDGSVIIPGWLAGTERHPRFAWVRILPDGSPDPRGIVETYFRGSEFANVVAVQPNGSVVVAGQSYSFEDDDSAGSAFAVARYGQDGALDPTFGSNGIAITPIGQRDDEPAAILFQPDGRIVVGGTMEHSGSYDYSHFAVVRYLAGPCGNGTLDPDEECDGGGCCTSSCTVAPAGTVCRPQRSACDVAEQCTGDTPDCPADAVVADGTACEDGKFCNGQESCRGGRCVTGPRPCTGACNESTRSCAPEPPPTSTTSSSTTSTTISTSTTVSGADDGRCGNHRLRTPARRLRCRLDAIRRRLHATPDGDIDARLRHRVSGRLRHLYAQLAYQSEAPLSGSDLRHIRRAVRRLEGLLERATTSPVAASQPPVR